MLNPAAAGAEPPGPVPRQLPADVRGFVNRRHDLDRLDELIDDSAASGAAIVVVGTAGVGKTSPAVHWAHRIRDRFPDGQLYVNLRGYDPGPPITPQEMLERFLHALGGPARRCPPTSNREVRCSGRSWPGGACSWCWTTPQRSARFGRCFPATANASYS
ncbi:ATP-binding protein [Amycolatopsis mediterranei]|uniref:Orc1-like AAA ATPase domain-containing protein n=2 Tax=Amycolatopsis mediterranei TaxID=33910 RepID=A0A0H3DCQ5_AMYMU|nr:ATP-binding protein [Amycolatopsis mediterranei]ADJ48491.1 conserved hypothetical protein [Amycolatopsis mediterranei U32]AEK45415.1 hypothetical protein RAM_34710 [Amycolatopsis mediterranei S699]KDO10792.1 hypothetical protein DV26_10810 [Amycolatopsis mediterranei]KDU86892.1 hypothetical protein DV36_39720 [Amycolatopsis mediterranei]UZF73481.1 ATP-binding protein [Amycolatopsis mediterranei]